MIVFMLKIEKNDEGGSWLKIYLLSFLITLSFTDLILIHFKQ
jgi:hypothetical protein